MKTLKKSLYWLLLILLGVLITFFILVNTSTGSRWLIHQAINNSGQDIAVTGISGTLAKKIVSEKIIYTNPVNDQSITIDDFQLEWNASLLLKKTLGIKSLSARRIEINSGQDKSSTEQETTDVLAVPELSLPIIIAIESLSIHQLSVAGQEQPLQINDIQLSTKMLHSALAINQLSLKYDDLSVDTTGQFDFTKPFPLQIDLQLSQSAAHPISTASSNVALTNSQNVTSKTTQKTISTVQIKGDLDRYRLTANVNLQADSHLDIDADVAGVGSLSKLEIEKLTILTLNGEITATGMVQWQDELKARLSVEGNNLNPSQLSKEMVGNLGLQGDLSWQNNQYEADFDLNGQLRDYPLQLKLVANGSDRTANIKQAKFHNGPNKLDLQGKVSVDSVENLSWKLDAPELATLYDGLAGTLQGKGLLNGRWENLTGSGNLTGSALRFQTNLIDQFELNLRPLPNVAKQYQVSMLATGLTLEQYAVKEVDVSLKGSIEQQISEYRILDKAGNQLSGIINSQRQQKKWQGSLLNTQLLTRYWPELKQQQKTTFHFEEGAAELSSFCLKGNLESLCLNGTHNTNNTDALLTLENIPLQRFKPWLAVSSELKDKMSGQVDIKRVAQAWTIQPQLYLDEQNKFEAQVKLNQETKKLAGNIHTRFHKLEWLTLLSNQVLQPKGIITSALTLNGSLEKPEIAGDVILKQASANLPDAGIEIADLELTVTAIDNTKASIVGYAKSGKGDLEINGKASWQTLSDWELKLAVTGSEFQVANLPEVRASASPEINLSIQKERIDINGSINIPQAKILLEELPDRAATVSKDARIINETSESEAKPASLPVYAEIQLKLGDDVRLDGKGLEAKLDGQMNIRETPGKPLQANGKINIPEGSYTAYGQDLNLAEGSIIFNGPISQPGLDLKAQREIGDIVAGLFIRGTLQNPESELFSIPAMPESDAISYLLTGKPLRSSGSEDGALITAALTKLGVKGSEGLVEEIRNTTGLSKLEIETGSDTTQTALLIGKYLTPQLYVQYVKRLFLESDSLQLQYDINDRLKLEAESGTSQGIDFIYQFER